MIRFINSLRRHRWRILGRLKIRGEVRKKVDSGQPVKVILGSSITGFDGWLSTDLPHFDITLAKDWDYLFKEGSIDNLLAEHVFEHLSPAQSETAFYLIRKYLKKNGVFRIAVPDGYHESPDYIEYTRPGGSGPGCDDHKILWNKDLLSKMSLECGLKIQLLQYYDSNHQFTDSYQDDQNGIILRSFEKLKSDQSTSFRMSSLIADLRVK